MNSLTNPPIEIATRPFNVTTWIPATATTGTDTAGSSTRMDWASVFLPGNALITGINLLIGTGGNGNIKAALFDFGGTLLAVSAAATSGTTARIQTIPFVTAYLAAGPAHYLIGVVLASGSDSLRTLPAYCNTGMFAGAATITANTPATFTPAAGATSTSSVFAASLY